MPASVENHSNKGSGKRVAVVGAGVSGLAAAYKLKSHGLNVTIFEADARAGGKLRSISKDGLIWDEGANTMTESDADVSYLLDNLGLREFQQFPISQNKRYIARNGVPMMLPMNPFDLLKSNILSAQSKLQLILEPFLWQRSKSVKAGNNHYQTQESVREFFQRHFGNEVVDYLIDPFVAGTSAGDPDSLSMRYSFPELWDLEQRFGSIIAGAFQSKLASKRDKSSEAKTSSRKRASFSFQGGMQKLSDRICQEFGRDELKLQAKVLSLAYGHGDKSEMENWSINYSSNHEQKPKPAFFDAVIMTAPLCNFKEMSITKRGNIFPLHYFPEVNYLPLSVIISTFKKENVKMPLEGFGVLVPSKERENGLRTLGTLFSSMMFPDRAPDDVHLYTTFVGGSRNPELANASTDELKAVVGSDLRQLLGADGEPTVIKHYFGSKAFPLYGKNYGLVLEAIEKLEAELPGLFYAGNHKGGLSVGKAITSGCKAADLAISYLDSFSVDNLSSTN